MTLPSHVDFHNQEYLTFLEKKTQLGTFDGFDPVWMPDFLFDFQRSLVEWAIRKGRAAIFADCGLGKTLMQLVWAENIVQKTGGKVLILTPLSVSAQTCAEAEKFGIETFRSRDGKTSAGITVVNYERLHYFNSADFAGCVCDESSILKNFDGVRKQEITDFMRKMRYRLLCTATAAPNDYIELGTSSEALGYLGYTDMLTRFFVNSQHTVKAMSFQNKHIADNKWRFKGHAEIPFWKWVCSWARSVRKPSDLGFEDGDFILPPLREQEHTVEVKTLAPGMLFSLPAVGLKEQRDERRRSINERCEMASSLVNNTNQPAIVWCHLNPEGDLLEREIPDAIQVSGDDSDDTKEGKFTAFSSGQARVLITKPKIGAWGLNFQHCAHMTFFPSHSFEQYYQGVRRCWRFGQRREVLVDIITTEGEQKILKNMQRKTAQAEVMFTQLIDHMNTAISIDRTISFTQREEIPSWL